MKMYALCDWQLLTGSHSCVDTLLPDLSDNCIYSSLTCKCTPLQQMSDPMYLSLGILEHPHSELNSLSDLWLYQL